MLSLKLDILDPLLTLLRGKPPDEPPSARDVQAMRDELCRARETQQAEALRHRLHMR